MQIYRKILITPKYLNEINIIIGLIILKPPSCFLSGMRDFSSVYSPTLHRKRQGAICHDEKVAYRPLIIYGDICNLHLRYYIFYDMADGIQMVTMPFTTLWGYDTDADRDGNYMFYVVFFTNNLVVKKKQCIFAAECCTRQFENKFSLRLFA